MISARHIKAWRKFNEELNEFIWEIEGDTALAEAGLYEDAHTIRSVRDFEITAGGVLSWIEEGMPNREQMANEDDAKEWLKFWKACFSRAKRYWEMDTEALDAIQDGVAQDADED